MIARLLLAAVLSGAIGITACEERHSSALPITTPPNAAGNGAVPETIQFPAEDQPVLFLHAKHVDLSKGDCTACHDKLFPQSVKAALSYAGREHRRAESSRRSCAACHVSGGKAFAAQGNCGRCHGGRDAAELAF